MSPAEQAKTDSLEKRLTWLDEQRRKDAELLRKLSTQLKAAEDLIGKQARQIQEISAEMARLAATASRVHSLDETLGKHRQEVSRQLERAEALRTERERSSDQSRRKDRDDFARRLAEVQTDLEDLELLRQAFQTTRDEGARLARTVAAQADRDEELARAVETQAEAATTQEDRLQQEARRFSDVQGQISEFRLRLEALRSSVESAEDRARALEIRAAELEAGEAERRASTATWMEGQQLRMADLERIWGEYARRFETFEKRATEIQERIYGYEDTHRAQRQLQVELEKTLERLEGKIVEIGEVHRLSEERQKQEMSAFLAEDRKRWSGFKLSADERDQENDRDHKHMTDELKRLEDTSLQALRGSLALEDALQRRMTELLSVLREWVGEADRPSNRVR